MDFKLYSRTNIFVVSPNKNSGILSNTFINLFIKIYNIKFTLNLYLNNLLHLILSLVLERLDDVEAIGFEF